MLKTLTAYMFKLIIFLSITLALAGCGKKEEAPAEVSKKPSKQPDMIEYKLTDGSTVIVDANLFGVKYLPNGNVFSYSYTSDERHLIDKLGKPFIQPVYKHELLMETTESIDNLITFFFPKTSHIATRRKQGMQDMYVRLVSTRDMDIIRSLDEPYVVIDMRVVFPQRPKIDRTQQQRPATSVVTASLDDQISALRNNLARLNDRMTQDDIQIPERRRLEIQISMLDKQLIDLNTKRDSILSSNDEAVQESNTDLSAVKSDKKVKIKIVSFNLRTEDKNK